MITRCTDCVRNFLMPYEYDAIKKISVVFSQDGVPVIVKTTDELYFDATTKIMTVHLKPGDTACFKAGDTDSRTIYIQIKVLLSNGATYASNLFKERLEDNLRGGVF